MGYVTIYMKYFKLTLESFVTNFHSTTNLLKIYIRFDYRFRSLCVVIATIVFFLYITFARKYHYFEYKEHKFGIIVYHSLILVLVAAFIVLEILLVNSVEKMV